VRRDVHGSLQKAGQDLPHAKEVKGAYLKVAATNSNSDSGL
jgi:hypothetical protein